MTYSKEQSQSLPDENFHYLIIDEEDHVLTITLNRPNNNNSLTPVMIRELAYALSYAHHQDHVWLVILQAKGEIFCSGTDLEIIKGVKEEHKSTIPDTKKNILIGDLFHKLYKPCIAKVEGNVLAGGLLILAGCTHVVACNDVKLGLPEVKNGIFPFQVMASLMENMPAKKVLDWCIRGYSMEVEMALQLGLVTHVTIQENIKEEISKLQNQILHNSPTAIRLGLEAFHEIRKMKAKKHHKYLNEMLMKSLSTNDAEEGKNAEKENRSPNWTGK